LYSLEHSELSKLEKQKLNAIIRNQSNEGQVKSVVARLFGLIGKNVFYPIEDVDVRKYLTRIVEAMTPEQRGDCLDHDYLYIKSIKQKINDLASEYAAKEFDNWLRVDKIRLQPEFKFSATIAPSEPASPIEKSLYVHEGKINGLEQDVIQKVAALDNVLWWHRNLEKGKGFVINGFVNHYPDFVVLTAKKNLIIIETKGGDRDNSDSAAKLKLGKTWENQANKLSHETGLRYHYMMVFDNNPLSEAYNVAAVMDLIKQL
jgi:type III restriction enzyme